MIELLEKGKLLMLPLMALSIVALAIFFERFLYFHRISLNLNEFLQGLCNLIKRKNYAEALYECSGTPGPITRVIHAILVRHEQPRQELKETGTEAAQLEVPRVEKYLGVLITITYLAPLIGLLGTVIGLVETFETIDSSYGFDSPTRLSSGIYQSLITSAGGLIVAIPTYIIYSYLAHAAKHMIHDMERAGIEIINAITDSKQITIAEPAKDTKNSETIKDKKSIKKQK